MIECVMRIKTEGKMSDEMGDMESKSGDGMSDDMSDVRARNKG